MDLGIPQVLADVGQQGLDLLGAPPQQLGEETQREGFQPFFDLHEVPCADGFLYEQFPY